MNNYNKEKINTWLYLKFDSDISESFGNELPYPHKHFINKNSFVYAWLIDGYFYSMKSYRYFNDVIARAMITFPEENVRKHKQFKDTKSNIKPFNLKEFQNLESIKYKAKNFASSDSLNCEDQVFWALKLYTEYLIRENGVFSYYLLEDFGFENFIDRTKDRSTLKAKCRSIYNWYAARDFKCQITYERKFTDEELSMSRADGMRKVRARVADETKKKVFNILTSMFKDEYKKANGKWNVSKIAKDTSLTRPTVMKYIKEFQGN